MLTDEQLQELERLDREATPGRWALASYDNGGWCVVGRGATCVLETDWDASWPCQPYDRDLIVAARNALPELVAEVRRLRELLAVLCGDGGHYQQAHGTAAAIEYGLGRFHEQSRLLDLAWAEVARQDREMTSCQECCSRERLRDIPAPVDN